ncbi:MAG: glycosyltransferase family 4 protein [Opitutaceae bacterium]
MLNLGQSLILRPDENGVDGDTAGEGSASIRWGSRARDSVIALYSNLETGFVTIDRQILDEAFGCKLVIVGRNASGVAAAVCTVARTSACVGWFASWHTFPVVLAAALLRKPFLLIIGGYDLANMPEIEYGHQRGGLKRWISLATMKLASRLMTNSEYSRGEGKRNAGLDPKTVGVVHHGVPDVFGKRPPKSWKRLVVTVGNVDRANLFRKGHEPFVRAAALLPDVEFRLIGSWRDDAIDYLKSIATTNVVFPGRVSDDELNASLMEASVYVQASAHEGFGMSLAEAMLACCVPVVSCNGAIPEVVGECGLYLSRITPEALAQNIEAALARGPIIGPVARERIIHSFPLEVRRRGLVREIRALIEDEGRVI